MEDYAIIQLVFKHLLAWELSTVNVLISGKKQSVKENTMNDVIFEERCISLYSDLRGWIIFNSVVSRMR